MVSARVRAEPGEAAVSRPQPAGGGRGRAAPRLGVATRVGALSGGGAAASCHLPRPRAVSSRGWGSEGGGGTPRRRQGLGAAGAPHDRCHIRARLRALPSSGSVR